MALDALTLAGNRTLDVLVEGRLDRPVVLAHHGTPSTATFWAEWARPLDEAGLSLVAYTRPGYTGSTRHPGRRVADAAVDASAVLDELRLERVVSLGYSGGCPHALALGALAPQRCAGVVAVAGIVPFEAGGVNFFAGMGQENLDEFAAAQAGEHALTRWMSDVGMPMLQADATSLAQAFGDLVDDTDRAVLDRGWARGVAEEFHRVHRGGPFGWVDDDLAFVRAWGFSPVDVTVPVTLWHAGRDRMAPVSHSRWMAQVIPTATYHEVSELGHLALLHQHRAAIIASVCSLVE